MLCLNPITANGREAFGCGQCGPCRVDKVRRKTAQLILESQQHSASAFVTATYSPHHLPLRTPTGTEATSTKRDVVPSVSTRHMEKLKTDLLRLGLTRWLIVSEYGEKTGRPHYHLLVFGVDALELEGFYQAGGWPYGFTHIRPLVSTTQMAYVAGYCWKKRAEQKYMPGQEPVQALVPKRPALGRRTVENIAHDLKSKKWFRENPTDVPHEFRHEGKLWPFSDRQKRIMREICSYPLTMGECRDRGLDSFSVSPDRPVPSLEDRLIRWNQQQKRKEIHAQKTDRI